jgi:hypothetical protein
VSAGDGCTSCARRARRRATRVKREPIEQGAVIGKLVDALSARTAGGDLDPLVALYAVSRQVELALAAAAVEARRAGHSWTTIAGELGVSRQAARQRWARYVADAGVADDVEVAP